MEDSDTVLLFFIDNPEFIRSQAEITVICMVCRLLPNHRHSKSHVEPFTCSGIVHSDKNEADMWRQIAFFDENVISPQM